MENLTGLTDEELDALKQSNLDNFIREQKRINDNTRNSFESQIKWNETTAELEQTILKIMEGMNKRYEKLYNHITVLYVCLLILALFELFQQFG